jgi:hypothetical protein
MEEAAENGKESSHSAHGNGRDEPLYTAVFTDYSMTKCHYVYSTISCQHYTRPNSGKTKRKVDQHTDTTAWMHIRHK